MCCDESLHMTGSERQIKSGTHKHAKSLSNNHCERHREGVDPFLNEVSVKGVRFYAACFTNQSRRAASRWAVIDGKMKRSVKMAFRRDTERRAFLEKRANSPQTPLQLNPTLLVSCCPPTGRKRAGGEEGAKETVLKDCGRSSVTDWQALSLRISSGLCWWNNRRGT